MSLIWIHEDAITLDHPVMDAAGSHAEPIFIWDTDRHDTLGYSLKRRMFIYECALDLNIPIYANNPYTVLTALSKGRAIYAANSPDPHIKDILSDLNESYDVVIIEAPSLTQVPDDTETGRFFRFWNKAKKTALVHSREQAVHGRDPQETDVKDKLSS